MWKIKTAEPLPRHVESILVTKVTVKLINGYMLRWHSTVIIKTKTDIKQRFKSISQPFKHLHKHDKTEIKRLSGEFDATDFQ